MHWRSRVSASGPARELLRSTQQPFAGLPSGAAAWTSSASLRATELPRRTSRAISVRTSRALHSGPPAPLSWSTISSRCFQGGCNAPPNPPPSPRYLFCDRHCVRAISGAEARHDAERRREAAERFALPTRRPVARRSRDHRDRRAVAAAHVLHGRRERRSVPDDRRRRELGADHRRQGARRVDRRHRRRAVRSEHHLPRHRLRRRAQQRLDRPRRVQDDRRRQDLAVRRALQRRPDRRRPHPSDRSEHRLGRGQRRHLQGEHRARHLQDDRRRQDLEEGAVPVRPARRDGRRAAARQPERRVRVDVAHRAQAMDDHQRLARRRLLQEHRRRRDVDEGHGRPAEASSSARATSR